MKICSQCKEKSLSGLRVSLCQYHYNALMWGRKWADKVKEEKVSK